MKITKLDIVCLVVAIVALAWGCYIQGYLNAIAQ